MFLILQINKIKHRVLKWDFSTEIGNTTSDVRQSHWKFL